MFLKLCVSLKCRLAYSTVSQRFVLKRLHYLPIIVIKLSPVTDIRFSVFSHRVEYENESIFSTNATICYFDNACSLNNQPRLERLVVDGRD